jgi:hypothetical protein
MSEKIYSNLAKVLDTLPNGFPATDSGVELKLLKRIFRPAESGCRFDSHRLYYGTVVAPADGQVLDEALFVVDQQQ